MSFRFLDDASGSFVVTAMMILHQVMYHLLTESEVITEKSQTEALMYSKVDTSRLRSEISL